MLFFWIHELLTTFAELRDGNCFFFVEYSLLCFVNIQQSSVGVAHVVTGHFITAVLPVERRV